MGKKTVLLLHGFLSSSQSTKARYLGDRFKTLPQAEFQAFDFNPTRTDFEYMTITGLINRLRQYLLDHDLGSVRLIGSSLGALVGLHYAHRFGGVERMLLLAPALFYMPGGLVEEEELERWEAGGSTKFLHYAFEEEIPLRYDHYVDGLQYQRPVPPPAPMAIIHGRNDDVVPVGHSRDYAAAFPDQVRLIEVDSDHRLGDQLALVWEHVQSFLLV